MTEPEHWNAEPVFKTVGGCVCLPVPPDEKVSKCTGRLHEALRAGAVLARFGVGHDGIDKPRATPGILCTNQPGVLPESVPEHTLALMLAARRVAQVASFGFKMKVAGCATTTRHGGAAGSLAGAALDVTHIEPYRPPHPEKDLRTFESIIMTPHAGSNTREADSRVARPAIHDTGWLWPGTSRTWIL